MRSTIERMGRAAGIAVFGITLCLTPHLPVAAGQGGDTKAGGLVYADFDAMVDGRPVSKRGGLVRIVSYEEKATHPTRFKGLANVNPPAPELVRLKADDPNHAAAFDFEFQMLNSYAGVGVEVNGQAERDKKRVPDDVSGFKYITLEAYATGVESLRVELISHGHGIELTGGYPQVTFKVAPGLNTYRLKLDSLRQPSWAQKVSAKDVLKNLTSVAVTAFCEQKCPPSKGTVVLDNIRFEN